MPAEERRRSPWAASPTGPMRATYQDVLDVPANRVAEIILSVSCMRAALGLIYFAPGSIPDPAVMGARLPTWAKEASGYEWPERRMESGV